MTSPVIGNSKCNNMAAQTQIDINLLTDQTLCGGRAGINEPRELDNIVVAIQVIGSGTGQMHMTCQCVRRTFRNLIRPGLGARWPAVKLKDQIHIESDVRAFRVNRSSHVEDARLLVVMAAQIYWHDKK